MNKVWLLVTLICFSTFTLSQEANAELQSVRFCAGIHEWPPYYYFERMEGNSTKNIKGLDIQLFDEIFKKNGISYTVTLLSWTKCLAEVIQGTKFDAVFGGGLNEHRRSSYLTTKGYYSVVPSYFYKKNSFPSGLNIKSSTDFKKFGHLCGVKGFNYVNFGVSNDDIDMGSDNYERLILKTLFGRCQISFARYQILEGWSQLLQMSFIENDELIFAPVPAVAKETFHLMISKNYKYRHELKKLFESEIDKLKETKKFSWLDVEPISP
jgi:polar amino acid transport system substrate-binding protein